MFSPHPCSLWRVLPIGFALLVLLAACGPGGQTLELTPTSRTTAAPSRSPTRTSHPATCPQTATSLDKSRLTGRIAYSTFASPETTDVYVMRADGSGQRQLTTKPGPEFDASWSPDGKQLVYRDSSKGINQDDEIYVMNADGSGKRNLTNNSANDWGPAWTHDVTKIAFKSTRGGNPYSQVYMMNADGSGVTRLTTDWGEYPAWSPDGKQMAFESRRDGNYEMYVMNADGSGQRNLTNNPADDGNAQWSPDGSKLVFDSERDSTQTSGSTGGGTPYPREIYVMNVDGSGVMRLTCSHGDTPAWSPDGTKIVFGSDSPGLGLYVMNADGSGVTQLTGGELLFPDWTR